MLAESMRLINRIKTSFLSMPLSTHNKRRDDQNSSRSLPYFVVREY